MMHPYFTYDLGALKDAKYQAFLLMKPLEGSLYELKRMFLLCIQVYPIKPGPEMLTRLLYSAEKLRCIFWLKAAQIQVVVNKYRYHAMAD